MKPVIALIGRPNVGKSTLFNQITKSRDALVADFAGLTRDRKYGDATYQNKSFIVVDTGGIGENAALVRELALGKLGLLGFDLDHERNLAARFGKSGFINKEGARPALVIPTNEELVIAQDAARLTT